MGVPADAARPGPPSRQAWACVPAHCSHAVCLGAAARARKCAALVAGVRSCETVVCLGFVGVAMYAYGNSSITTAAKTWERRWPRVWRGCPSCSCTRWMPRRRHTHLERWPRPG